MTRLFRNVDGVEACWQSDCDCNAPASRWWPFDNANGGVSAFAYCDAHTPGRIMYGPMSRDELSAWEVHRS
jgi:hypothetical protein